MSERRLVGIVLGIASAHTVTGARWGRQHGCQTQGVAHGGEPQRG